MDKIVLVLNIVFAVFLIIGFLKGLKGAKKSGLKLGIFIVVIILAGILTPFVSKLVMQIQISFNGVKTPINEIIIQTISEADEIKEFIVASPSFAALIQNFPLMIGNLFVFVILCYILRFFGWIVYLVVASALFKDKTVKIDENGNEVNGSKFRLLGGLFGGIKALLLLFVTFMPLSGAIGLISDLSTSATVSAEQVAVVEKTPTQELFEEYLPEEAFEIIGYYNQSMISKFTGIFNLDDKCFDSVSKINIDGNTIKLRSEVITFSKVYDNVNFLMNLDFSTMESIKDLDFDKLRAAIGYVFDSDILQTVLPELSNFGCEKLLEMDEVNANSDYKGIVTSIKNEIAGDNVVQNLKNECFAILDTLKTIVTSGLYDEFIKEEVDIDAISDILSNNDYAVIDQIITDLSQSKILNKGIVFGFNLLIEELDKELDVLTNTDVQLTKIDIASESAVVNKEDVKTLAKNIAKIITLVKDVPASEVDSDYTVLFNTKYSPIISYIGISMDTIKNMKVLKDVDLYNKCMDALNLTEYAEYFDFTKLKGDNIWTNETKNLQNIFDAIVDSGVISYIENAETEGSDTFANIINALATTKTVDGKTKTNLRKIIEPLFESNILEKPAKYGFTKLDVLLNDWVKKIVDNADVGSMNTSNLFTETEKEKILSSFDNLVIYLNGLDFDNFIESPIVELLGSDVSLLGSVMDSLKSTELFGDVTVAETTTDGVYTKFIKCLKETSYKDYIGFDEILSSTFSWNSELSSTKDMISALVEKTVVVDSEEILLIEYIMQSDADWELVFDQISSEDLTNIFTPLLNSKILKPTANMVINKLNEQIKNLVGETLGNDIPVSIDLTDITEEEVEQIIEVIDSAKDLIQEFSDEDFEISDLATGDNKELLVDLLDDLQTNALNDGVFKESYEAVIDFVKEDATIGEDVTSLIESNTTDGVIDWNAVIAGLNPIVP